MTPSIENAALRHSLLDEALVRWRCVARGELHRGSLPELFAAMAADTVRDFPALRPHQRHPWHAFLAQLGAIALHRTEQSQPWTKAADWRAALLSLTPEDADGAAWCLVAPPERPALLQPAAAGERFGGADYAGMFDGGNDDARGRVAGEAEDGEVIRFGSTAGEEQLIGIHAGRFRP